MIKLAIAILMASAAAAAADERIHQQPPSPEECKGQLPSGYCVRGETWYRLKDGRVQWILDRKSPSQNSDFWNDQEKWGGGTSDTTATGGASK